LVFPTGSFVVAAYSTTAAPVPMRKWDVVRVNQVNSYAAAFTTVDCSIPPGLDPSGGFVVLHDKTIQIFDPSRNVRKSLTERSGSEKVSARANAIAMPLLPQNPHSILVHPQGGRALFVGEDGSNWLEWEDSTPSG
jgi:hypothetical protein